MDLIPVTDDPSDGARDTVAIRLSDEARKMARVETIPAERKFVEKEIRLPARLEVDETAVTRVAARFPGRLDRLYADYTGIPVRRGDHLADIYSPELVTAQQELIAARQAVDQATQPAVRKRARQTLQAARDKLRLWGLTEAQIEQLAGREEPQSHITLHAPQTGIVLKRHVEEGAYVQTGSAIYDLVDLNRLWLIMDAYEQDLPFIHYGQSITFEIPALPGRVFTGRVAFIQPVLDPRLRSARVRANVSNPNGMLRPGMLAQVRLQVALTEDSTVIAPELAGKWISPMHPEIVKDEPGTCDICGMDLVPVEQMGYADRQAQPPLVVPATAVLRTGKRAVIYVRDDRDPQRYAAREIILGPRLGDFFAVKSGLREGEQVVVQGAFMIDSESQIQARPSMMNPPEQDIAESGEPAQSTGPVITLSDRAQTLLRDLMQEYYALAEALSRDDVPSARRAAGRLLDYWRQLADALPADEWSRQHQTATAALQTLNGEQAALQRQREAFRELSDALIALWRAADLAMTTHLTYCPMAFNDQGAWWLQAEAEEIRNPYFGEVMLRCGAFEEQLGAGPPSDASPEDAHAH
jgi:Cu(I)/Ag(I) efflux system membrane fusion protein